MRHALVVLVLLAVVALSIDGRSALSQSGVAEESSVLGGGALDPTFGARGKVRTDFGQIDDIQDLAIQRDGKIVAVGTTQNQTTFDTQSVLARYKVDGSLDASFGAGGKVTIEFGRETSASAVALQSDGKIITAGAASGGPTGADIALARHNADGTLDASFGVGGLVVTDFDMTREGANGLVIQPDGKLVVVGSTRPFGPIETSPANFALARYNPNGSLDQSFDGDGKVSTDFAPGRDELGYGIALAPDGKIVVAGWGLPNVRPGERNAIDIARYNADGSLDASFGGDGRVISAPGGEDLAFAVVVQPDAKVVVAGSVLGTRSGLALIRYTAGGSLDSTFGTGGVASADYGSQHALAFDLVRQPDGKLVAAGTTSPESGDLAGNAFAVARFERSGNPDRSFRGGAISTDFGAWDEARAVAIQADGKVVVGGSSAQYQPGGPITAGDFALARYLGAPPRCRVPNVRLKTLAVARSAITKAGCRLGKVTRRASTKVKRGRVISQSPKAGKTLSNRSKVDLVVSRGRR